MCIRDRLAVGVAVGIYFALQPYVDTEEIGWMCILGAAPFAACGFFTYHGMTCLLYTSQIKQRLPFIDLIRGITIIEMISYHFLWDLVYLYNADIP